MPKTRRGVNGARIFSSWIKIEFFNRISHFATFVAKLFLPFLGRGHYAPRILSVSRVFTIVARGELHASSLKSPDFVSCLFRVGQVVLIPFNEVAIYSFLR